jgi:hypothetical protein
MLREPVFASPRRQVYGFFGLIGQLGAKVS